MPDGSEVKGPEERVPHEVSVRANVALIFIKPHAHTPECVEFVRSELAKVSGLHILGESDMTGETIAECGFVDKHYAEISKFALSEPPSAIQTSPEAVAAFKEKFGMEWGEAVEAGKVVNAQEYLTKEDSSQLFELWQGCGDKVKLCPGAYVGRVRGGDEDEEDEPSLFVVDGFYPALREKFTRQGAKIRLFVVGFDPKVLSWADFRKRVVGATNPAKAAEGSLRAQILARYESLGLDQAPDNTDNGVHGSAGPLEALKERLLWLNFPLEKDPTGMRLVELAVWDSQSSAEAVVGNLLENPTLTTRDGTTGTAFDLTEDQDTPHLFHLANNLAFKETLDDFFSENVGKTT